MNGDPATVAVEACIPEPAGSDLTAEIEAVEDRIRAMEIAAKIPD